MEGFWRAAQPPSCSLQGAFVIVWRSAKRERAAKKEAPLETKGDASVRPWKRYAGWPARDESKWSTLAQRFVTASAEDSRASSLVRSPATPPMAPSWSPIATAAARALPAMSWVRPETRISRVMLARICRNSAVPGREDEYLFNYIYDARVYNPETVMPPWGGHGVFNDQEIGDMVAFLKTLKKPAVFKVEVDDPEKRAAPVEKRENLDPIENPGMWAVDKAQELWKQKQLGRLLVQHLPQRPEGAVQDLGGVDAEVGAAAQQGAGRRGVRDAPCQGHHGCRTG